MTSKLIMWDQYFHFFSNGKVGDLIIAHHIILKIVEANVPSFTTLQQVGGDELFFLVEKKRYVGSYTPGLIYPHYTLTRLSRLRLTGLLNEK